ncbi:helix-turn-helix domain-containing protein [Streptacidiphilus carbonis]|uniref:helix-turn-helix domain-containing protein n=1 Tax=Streptacidiphilus carbonis TaxID=105422 RepID=UPI0005A64844|nr:helix-turn-helix transcriptional regulator [Streptacidiphilus carbonis]
MCRNEAPVDLRIQAVGKLATYLRELREGAACTNAELAELLDVDVVTVRRAASGSMVPKRSFVQAWTELCGGKTDEAVALWRQARYQYRRITSGRPSTALPNPDLVSTPEMLSEALVELYERAGAPTYREMEQRGGQFGILPRNTARRIVLRQTLPVSEGQFRAFLDACEVRRTKAWIDARNRIVAMQHLRSADGNFGSFGLEATMMKLVKADSHSSLRWDVRSVIECEPTAAPAAWFDTVKPFTQTQMRCPTGQRPGRASPLIRSARPAVRV